MKLHILSDLHMESTDYLPPPVDCDIIVVAGDVSPGPAGIKWLEKTYPRHPLVYVAGNHEYYGCSLNTLNEH